MLIENVVCEKLQNWDPETTYSPFLEGILGSKGRVAFYSFVHSLVTTFGMSLYEEVALIMARSSGLQAERKFVNVGTVPPQVDSLVNSIVTQLAERRQKADKQVETEKIRQELKAFGILAPNRGRDKIVDLWIKTHDGTEYLFDIKTVKPNIEDFRDFKRKLLRWVALRISQMPTVSIVTALALPYNPYYPEPYDRFTMRGMFDTEHELFVAEEFWEFVGGRGAFSELIDIFTEVGKKLKPDIDRFLTELS